VRSAPDGDSIAKAANPTQIARFPPGGFATLAPSPGEG
jgi:hypothetical protein